MSAFPLNHRITLPPIAFYSASHCLPFPFTLILTPTDFKSKNCLRELVHSVRTNKPLIAVAERDEDNHGGLSEVEARQQCLDSGGKFASWDHFGLKAREVPAPVALADALLGPAHTLSAPCKAMAVADDGKPIVYERVGAFQQTMLRLIVQRLAPQRKMYLPGELGTGHMQPLPPPAKQFHIWYSRHNPGVRELIEEARC